MEKHNNQFRDPTKKVRLIDAYSTEEQMKISDKPAWMIVRDMPTVEVEDASGNMNYCPNCGADIRERKDNERKAY